MRRERVISAQPFKTQYAPDYGRDCFPVLGFARQLLQSEFGDGVEPRLAVVFRSTPFRSDPALLLQAEQRRVNGSLIQLQNVVAQLLDAARNTEAVQPPQGVQGFEHHQVESTLQYFCFLVAHGCSFGYTKEAIITPL